MRSSDREANESLLSYLRACVCVCVFGEWGGGGTYAADGRVAESIRLMESMSVGKLHVEVVLRAYKL